MPTLHISILLSSLALLQNIGSRPVPQRLVLEDLPQKLGVQAACVSPKGDFVVISHTKSEDRVRSITVYDLKTKRVIRRIETSFHLWVSFLDFAPDGRHFVAADWHGNAKAFDITGALKDEFRVFERARNDLGAIKFIDNESVLVIPIEPLALQHNIRSGARKLFCLDGPVIMAAAITGPELGCAWVTRNWVAIWCPALDQRNPVIRIEAPDEKIRHSSLIPTTPGRLRWASGTGGAVFC